MIEGGAQTQRKSAPRPLEARDEEARSKLNSNRMRRVAA